MYKKILIQFLLLTILSLVVLSTFFFYFNKKENLKEANIQLAKAKLAGFPDSFVLATKDGKRITLEEAKLLLRKK